MYLITLLKSFLVSEPRGFKSALEQSYLVTYPLRLSSRFEEPNTK